ncbi:50S ribosomal protein L18 [Candidatus Falkowbacteria bacterium]|jgi:large subunit ribosomal protein L18|nr:50S ribosomal protein L18 [Candidatus Falkowbacteria bacterium]
MNKEQKIKVTNRIQRANKTRAKLSNSDLPRLSVHRSLKHISAQIINGQKTICSVNDTQIKESKGKKPMEIAVLVGSQLAKKALDNKVDKVVFDRAYYKFHGRVKALADAAREAGLKF